MNNGYVADIPLDLAIGAHRGTSFVPEKRGAQERADYAADLAEDHENLAKLATTDEKREILALEFARYRAGLRARTLDHLQAKGRCLSSMITGPSNFPTRRNEKANNAEHNKMQALIEYREKALRTIRRKLQPELAPIMSGDSDATQHLRAKIEKAEALQALMKASNAAIRKHKKAGPVAQVAGLVKVGLSEGVAAELIKPDFAGRIGFASYQLTNNNANLRRMKGRLAGIERDQATPDETQEGEYARVEDCPAENRVRLFFPGKPDAEVRGTLKSNGFRWARSLGCWQAYRNRPALELAAKIAGV